MRVLELGVVLTAICPAQDDGLELHATPQGVEVLAGPVVLHADLFLQWGGHTFSYLLEGERGVFWSGKTTRTGPALLGQFPHPGSDLPVRVVELPTLDVALDQVVQPQMLRTPDGHLHVFVGYEPVEKNRGEIRYFRSARPEDVTELVDVSHRIPKGKYATFAPARKNVGIDRLGQRAVLVAMTASSSGEYVRNTPLAFLGEREGLDFVFAEPVVFGEPRHFFYPQVVASDDGPVLVGSVSYGPSRHCELVHLGWDGEVLLEEKLPRPRGLVSAYSNEIEPLDETWSELLMVREIAPKTRPDRTLEMWVYDTQARELDLRRSWDFDVEQDSCLSAAGQLVVREDGRPLFLNDPHSRAVHVWEGDLAGEGSIRVAPLPRTDTRDFGFAPIRSVFAPSVLQGSIPCRGERWIAVDAMHPAAGDADRPCAMLAWRIRL